MMLPIKSLGGFKETETSGINWEQFILMSLRFFDFLTASSKSLPPFSHITPMHCIPKLTIDMILSTGFAHECEGAVLPAISISRSRFRNNAINDS